MRRGLNGIGQPTRSDSDAKRSVTNGTDAGFVPTVSPDSGSSIGPSAIDGLLTVAAVAASLRVCEATVYKLCAKAQLGHLRVGSTAHHEG
jgi:hypothetical protein